MSKLFNELTKKQAALELIRKGIKKFKPGIFKTGQYPNNLRTEGTASKGQEVIKKFLISDSPKMLARFGSTELAAFCNWMQVNDKLERDYRYSDIRYIKGESFPSWFSVSTRRGLPRNSGFFPSNTESFQKWGGIVEKDIAELDLLFQWQDNEKYLSSYLDGIPRVLNSEMYFPYNYKNPWSQALSNKKILVVSPFAETIEKQFVNREKLFPNPDVLPEFDLQTIKAYNIIDQCNPYKEINSWIEGLESLKERMSGKQYDIALIGCGAYAFDLAAHAKRMGKIGMTLCGSLQVLFGIYGVRYEDYLRSLGILNEYWVRPSRKERPKGYKSVENGAYW